MRYGIKIRRQEIEGVEGKVKCFQCWGVGHKTWECPIIKVKRRVYEEEAVHVAILQKV